MSKPKWKFNSECDSLWFVCNNWKKKLKFIESEARKNVDYEIGLNDVVPISFSVSIAFNWQLFTRMRVRKVCSCLVRWIKKHVHRFNRRNVVVRLNDMCASYSHMIEPELYTLQPSDRTKWTKRKKRKQFKKKTKVIFFRDFTFSWYGDTA